MILCLFINSTFYVLYSTRKQWILLLFFPLSLFCILLTMYYFTYPFLFHFIGETEDISFNWNITRVFRLIDFTYMGFRSLYLDILLVLLISIGTCDKFYICIWNGNIKFFSIRNTFWMTPRNAQHRPLLFYTTACPPLWIHPFSRMFKTNIIILAIRKFVI